MFVSRPFFDPAFTWGGAPVFGFPAEELQQPRVRYGTVPQGGRRPSGVPPRAYYLGRPAQHCWPYHHQHHQHHHDEDFYDASSDTDLDENYHDADEGRDEWEQEAAAAGPARTAMTAPQPWPAAASCGPRAKARSGSGGAPRMAAAWADPFANAAAPCAAAYGQPPCAAGLQQQQQQQPRSHRQQQQQQQQRQRRQTQQAQQQQRQCPKPAAAPKQPTRVHFPVRDAGSSRDQQQQRAPKQPQPQQAAAAKPAARPAKQLTKAEAATVIQSWWRMHRLAQQHAALKALIAVSSKLRLVAAKFESYKQEAASAAGHISHKQYLELNELAMRVLEQLDCTPCGVVELRAVRKRLAASAISLLDRVQQAFSASVTAAMQGEQEQQQQQQPAGAAADAPAVSVRLVFPNSLCDAGTQTDM